MKWLKNLFKPSEAKFKVGDFLYCTADEFPDYYSYIIITDVGKRNYQYCFGVNMGGMRHQMSRNYIERVYVTVENPDSVIKRFAHR